MLPSYSDLNIRHIHGPPGSGKTERAMNHVQQLLERGESPDNLGFTTFTRAGVQTFEQRIQDRTGLRGRSDLPHVGTVHSLCYRLLGLRRSQVMMPPDWARFCDVHEYEYSAENWQLDQGLAEPTERGIKDADQLRAFYDRYRTTGGVDLETSWEHYEWYQGRPSLARVLQFVDNYDAYRAEHDKLDFTDMLTTVLAEGVSPTAKQWIVDEAQDLNYLQIQVLWFWLRSASSVIFFSDINQTIYSFAGADPTWLLSLPMTEDLHRSRRVPRRPRDLAVKLIARNRQRHPVPFEARNDEGQVSRTWHGPENIVDGFPLSGETTGVLVRNRYLLKDWVDALRRSGLPFQNLRGFSPLRDVPRGVKIALQVAHGKQITVQELSSLLREIPQKEWLPRGVKAQVQRLVKSNESRSFSLTDILAITAAERLTTMLSNLRTCLEPLRTPVGEWKNYLVDLVRRFGLDTLYETEPITLSTIHGAKGMEFDHVWLSTDMSKRTRAASLKDSEAERRVFYVGLTRCSQSLHLLRSSRNYHYRELI